MQTHPHNSSLRGEPLEKFGTAADPPMYPGGGKIYPSTGRAPNRRELYFSFIYKNIYFCETFKYTQKWKNQSCLSRD